MRGTLAAAAVVAAGVFMSAPVMAQQFGSKGTAAFSADRLFGLSLHHESQEVGRGVSVSADTTDFGIVWRPAQDPYEVPRLSFDYFVIDGLNIGGSIAFASVGGDRSESDFLFAPRVGYIWMFSDVVGFWLRGGLTYHNRDIPGPPSEWGLALTAEGMFMISPVDHFGFVVGPTFDITMVGKYHGGPGSPSLDRNYRNFGIFNAGLVGWL